MNGAKLTMAVFATTALAGLIIYSSLDDPATSSAAATPATAAAADPAQAIDPQWAMRSKGDSTAAVTIFEMSDFLCPWCKRFADSTYPAMDREYIQTGKVQLIFVNLPIPSLHPNAPAGHEFAMCVAAEGKFWELHDMLFAQQGEWATLENLEPYFRGLAEELGLSYASLEGCLQAGDMRALVAADVNTARRAQIANTPTFVVRPNDPQAQAVLIPGAAGMDVWRPLLDSLVALREGG